MTNKEVIQLFAKYEPELIAECFEDCYNIGKYDGYNDVDTAPPFWIKAWLTDEYDKNFFREQDVERLLEKQKEESDSMPWQRVNDILNKDQAKRFIEAIEASEKWTEEHKK